MHPQRGKTSLTNEKIPLFLVGVGYIGGSLLMSLVDSGRYQITALTRSEDQVKVLKTLGVRPVFGTLDSGELIEKETRDNDVIIHSATADDQPSVKAILKGLENRPAGRPPAVYIHTSGTGLLKDGGEGISDEAHHYSDDRPQEIDALPDNAFHRDVDLLIKTAVESGKIGEARVTIIIPPIIHGLGTGPFNNISIDVPAWAKKSMESKIVTVVGQGKNVWSNIHILDLVSAYQMILDSLLSSSPPHPMYFFAETGTHRWLDLAKELQRVLLEKGLVSDELKFDPTPAYWGTNSRSSADLLRAMGWKPKKPMTIFESVNLEVDEVLKSLKK
ncbi:NAD(P)-binding protein [Meredithblackwellia eburnea MCA 4105]